MMMEDGAQHCTSAPSAAAVARGTNWLAPLVAIWVTDKISNQRRPRTWPQKSDPQSAKS